MGDLRYANEKFCAAVGALVGNGLLQKRLQNAFVSFGLIQPGDFKDPAIRAKYEEIMQRLTAVKDDPNKGEVPATLEKMTNKDAESLSNLIAELAFDIQEAVAKGSN